MSVCSVVQRGSSSPSAALGVAFVGSVSSGWGSFRRAKSVGLIATVSRFHQRSSDAGGIPGHTCRTKSLLISLQAIKNSGPEAIARADPSDSLPAITQSSTPTLATHSQQNYCRNRTLSLQRAASKAALPEGV